MRKSMFVVLLAVAMESVGCGDSKPSLNLTPMTAEQKQKIKDEDRQVFEAEGGKPRPKVKR